MTSNDSLHQSQHTACSASESPRADSHANERREERIIRCNQLLIEADRMMADVKRVAATNTPLATRQVFVETYMQWYTDSCAIILADLRAQFETDYATCINNCRSIAGLLADLTDAEPDGKRRGRFSTWWFTYLVNEQCDALRITRRALFPRVAQMPYDVRYLIATICKRVYHKYSIKRLFIDNGCLPTWWMPALKPVDSQRMAQVMGWFDGIVLYAPEHELPIARAVCEEILRKPRLGEDIGKELSNILQRLSPTPAPSLQSAPLDDTTAHLREQLAIHRQRLSILELQEARQGYNTPPEIRMEIDDLRRRTHNLEQVLTGAHKTI